MKEKGKGMLGMTGWLDDIINCSNSKESNSSTTVNNIHIHQDEEANPLASKWTDKTENMLMVVQV